MYTIILRSRDGLEREYGTVDRLPQGGMTTALLPPRILATTGEIDPIETRHYNFHTMEEWNGRRYHIFLERP